MAKNRIDSILDSQEFLTCNGSSLNGKFTAYSFGCSFTTTTYAGTSYASIITNWSGQEFIDQKNNFAEDGRGTNYLATEFENYIRVNGAVDPNALYLVYMGPNDVGNVLNDLLGLLLSSYSDNIADTVNGMLNGTISIPKLDSTLAITNNMKDFLNKIIAAGGEKIIVPTHFNDYYRQEFSMMGSDSAERKSFGALLSKVFNDAVSMAIEEVALPNVKFIRPDYAKLVEVVSNNPSAYLLDEEIQDTYNNYGMFGTKNYFHPTASAHMLNAKYITTMINEEFGLEPVSYDIVHNIGDTLNYDAVNFVQ